MSLADIIVVSNFRGPSLSSIYLNPIPKERVIKGSIMFALLIGTFLPLCRVHERSPKSTMSFHGAVDLLGTN